MEEVDEKGDVWWTEFGKVYNSERGFVCFVGPN